MTRSLVITRWSEAGLGLVLLALTTVCASAAGPERVLILDPFGRDVAPFSTVISAFPTTLARELGEPVKNEALRRLHEVANAPLFGYSASEFGLGPIGGRLYQDSEVGADGARTAIRILRGESPGASPQVLRRAPVFDWRELQRWGISEARLPAGSLSSSFASRASGSVTGGR